MFADNYQSWETFEQQKVECHRQLDQADKEFASIRKIFDLRNGPSDYKARKSASEASRESIETIFKSINECNECIQVTHKAIMDASNQLIFYIERTNP